MNNVLGVDACKSGWVGVVHSGDAVTVHVAPTIGALVTLAGSPAVIAIDMPIGLPDRSSRQADRLARDLLGAKRSSIFMTPIRATLAASSHEEASEINRAKTGQGISIQAFRLLPKIREVDDWRQKAPGQVVEVHPEASFTELAKESLPLDDLWPSEPLPSKKTWAGAERRRSLLAAAGFAPTGCIGEAGRRAAVDDVLDAAVAAWTARRVHDGTALSLPEPPEVFRDGVAAAIWR